MVGTDFQRVVTVLVGRARGNHDHRQMLVLLVGANVAQQIEAIHARHFDVRENDIGLHIEQLFQGIDAVLGKHDLIAFA